MGETNAREEQDGLMKTLSPSEVTLDPNEAEQKGSGLFVKKSEGETNEKQDDGKQNEEKKNEEQHNALPVSSIEDPKQSSYIEGKPQQGDVMENIPVCEIIVETNEADQKDSGLFSLPGKEHEEGTNVNPVAVVELKQPGDSEEKTHNKAGDEKEGEKEGENKTKEKIVGHTEEKAGEQREENNDA